MSPRVTLTVLALFCATMNLLLWRAEYGSGLENGTPVSSDVVLERLLTAPDASTLEVVRQGTSLGYLHWYPDAGEDATAKGPLTSDFVPEGMVRAPQPLTLKLDGNVKALDADTHLRFDLTLTLSSNRVWQELVLHLSARPVQVDLRVDARREELTWRLSRGDAPPWSQTLTFEELKDPRTLLASLGNPGLAALTAPLAAAPWATNHSAALRWDARQDWFALGRARIRAYRLRARFFDRYEVIVHANRVGEILRVDLPDGTRLVNSVLAGM